MLNFDATIKSVKLEQVTSFIDQLKRNKGHSWHHEAIAQSGCLDAILSGQIQIVQLFLDNSFPPNKLVDENKENATSRRPLIHFAAKTGNLPIVQLLVGKGGLNNRKNDHFYYRDAMQAAEGHANIVNFLKKCNGNESQIPIINELDISLKQAVLNEDLKEVVMLYKNGANLNFEIKGETLLGIAVSNIGSEEPASKMIEIIKFLLNNGADPNKKSLDDGDKLLPLAQAALKKATE